MYIALSFLFSEKGYIHFVITSVFNLRSYVRVSSTENAQVTGCCLKVKSRNINLARYVATSCIKLLNNLL